jgi:O-antigen/teichoic acid export membrane protein
MSLTAKPVIRIWAGAVAVPSTSLIVWLAIYSVFGIWLMAAGQMMVGLERVNPLAISLVLCALGIIGFGIGLSPRWGLTGIAFGMALSKIVTFWPIQIREVRRLLRYTPSKLTTVAEPVS